MVFISNSREQSMESLEDFWGVCLNESNKKVLWNGNDITELDDGLDQNDVEQTLELRQACLGENAKEGERNIVNLTADDGSGNELKQSILSMKLGVHEQTQLFLTLFPPITLELVSGKGPVYISGTVTSKLGSESDEDDDDEDEGEEEMENTSASLSPAVAVTRAVGKKRPADSPVQKPAKAVKVEKKDDKSSVPAKGSKSKKPSEDEDEDDDDEGEEDSEGDDEEAESGEEVEIQAKPAKLKTNASIQKKTQATPATPKSGGVTAGTKEESGKKQGKQEPMSIDDIKDKLLKTPTIPKKVDKFNNYISNSYKITDDKIKKQLWEFVQKNRPQS